MTTPDPSSSLHTKLQAILLAPFKDSGNMTAMHDDKDKPSAIDQQIAHIKAAFQDEGWHSQEEFGRLVETLTNNYGQMFYDRFKAELDSGLALPEVMRLWVIKCAEVAAGIEEGPPKLCDSQFYPWLKKKVDGEKGIEGTDE